MNTLVSQNEQSSIAVEDLLLDNNNPRFAGLDQERVNQTDILDFIVKQFGVEDVLSSIAVNGYFAAEPVVCTTKNGKYVVAEGNRRLAACLILLEDERAKNQDRLTKKYQKIHQDHGKKSVSPIPAIVLDSEGGNRDLLSYLGVRHIAAAKAWDSYAKAVWIHRVVTEGGISLDDAAAMIGDENKTLAHLLEGYHFVQQLVAEDRFRPEDSNRKGRGSNTNYPFSWVYTILSYRVVRDFLGIESGDPTRENPVPRKKIDDAALVMTAMFGNRSSGKSSAVSDSRQLRQLALILEDEEKTELLRQGKNLEEIIRETEPLDVRLRSGLTESKEILGDLSTRLTANGVSSEIAKKFTNLSGQVKNLASSVDKSLRETSGEDDA